jgi:hypothetical protein
MFNRFLKNKYVKIFFVFVGVVILLLTIVSAFAVIDYKLNNYSSAKEYYYCKTEFNKDDIYQKDKSKFFDVAVFKEDKTPLVTFYMVSPKVVEKFDNDSEVGFWGLANVEGHCVLRKYTIAYKGLEGGWAEGVSTNVYVKDQFVDYTSALSGITLGKNIDVTVVNQDNFSAYKDLSCKDGVKIAKYDGQRDLCILNSKFELQKDGYYIFVIALD